MLFEFDSDQRLLRDTVRDVLAKECPPALVRRAHDAVDRHNLRTGSDDDQYRSGRLPDRPDP
ncbi:hypothetical protein FAGKG844_280053 [Frankia sp. AgKG'84/4]|nr:acyl-CoA dehydrogenase family protein [Frankia sp. AgKG'84/4]MCL9793005.1 acyl-CoA dehydrogenase family protein [Frankia sp. AgKG'84/4]